MRRHHCGVWEDKRLGLIVFRQAVVAHRSTVFVILQEVDGSLFLGAVETAPAHEEEEDETDGDRANHAAYYASNDSADVH